MTKTEEFIYLAAFRYALGRATYAPSLVIEELSKHIDEFSLDFLQKLVFEISHAYSLGDSFNQIVWLNFKKDLQQQIENYDESKNDIERHH